MDELKQRFIAAGGKNMDRKNPLWDELFAAYKAANPRKRLSRACGSCYSTAYSWLIKQ